MFNFGPTNSLIPPRKGRAIAHARVPQTGPDADRGRAARTPSVVTNDELVRGALAQLLFA